MAIDISLVDLPEGWITATDPISGNLYYANPSTGQTSWQPPIQQFSSPPLIPPPPPPRVHPVQPSFPRNKPLDFRGSNACTINTQGLLIPSARAIINEPVNNTSTSSIPVELQMKAGMIADLCHVQSNYRREEGESWIPYEPLKVMDLPISLCVDKIAESRLEVRLISLMETLQNIP